MKYAKYMWMCLGALPLAVGAGTLTIDNSAPTSDVIASNAGTGSYTRAFAESETSTNRGRGQSLVTSDTGDFGLGWQLEELALLKSGSQTFTDGELTLWIFKWDPSDSGTDTAAWVSGDGMDDGDPLNGTGMEAIVDGEVFSLGDTTIDGGSFLYFDLSSLAPVLSSNTAYGFYVEYTPNSDGETYFQLSQQVGYSSGVLLNGYDGSNTVNTGQDLTFYLTATTVDVDIRTRISAAATEMASGSSVDIEVVFDDAATSAELSNDHDFEVIDLLALDTDNDGVVTVSVSKTTSEVLETITYTASATVGSEVYDASVEVDVFSEDYETVLDADFNDALDLQPNDLAESLNWETSTGSWSDFVDASLETYGIENNSDDTNSALVLDRATVGGGNASIRANFTSPITFENAPATLSWDWGRTRTGYEEKRIYLNAYDENDNLVYGVRMSHTSGVSETNNGSNYTQTGIGKSEPGSGSVGEGKYNPAKMGSISVRFNPTGSDPTEIEINGSITSSVAPASTNISYIIVGALSNTQNFGGLFDTFLARGVSYVPTGMAASPTVLTPGQTTELTITFDPAADSVELGNSLDSTVDDLMALDTDNDGVVVLTKSPTANVTYTTTVTGGSNPGTTEVSVGVFSDPAANDLSVAILADSPKLYYRFEEAAGAGYVFDSSGNGFHTSDILGTPVQGAPAVPGSVGNAMQMPGDVSILSPATSAMDQSFTLCAMVNVTESASGLPQLIYGMTDGAGTGRSVFYLTSGGQMISFLNGGNVVDDSGTILPDGTSCLLHMVYDAGSGDGSDDVVRFYINGVQSGGDVEVPGDAVPENTGNWVLGSHKVRTLHFLDGYMDEAAVFETALSETRIAAQGAAFLNASDPLLGFVSDSVEINYGESVTFDWSVSNQATAVQINGVDQGITVGNGGTYTTVLSPSSTTTYTIEVFYGDSGESVTSEITVTVIGGVTGLVEITSVSTDGGTPPNVTIEYTGAPNTQYNLETSPTMEEGTWTDLGPQAATDEEGIGTTTVTGSGDARFYRFVQP